jgi:hypothetical protein
VDCSSAQRSAGKNVFMVEDANHMEVCKPPSKEHASYELLRELINTFQSGSFNDLVARECDQSAVKNISRGMKRNCAEFIQGKDSNNPESEERLTPARGMAPLTCEL